MINREELFSVWDIWDGDFPPPLSELARLSNDSHAQHPATLRFANSMVGAEESAGMSEVYLCQNQATDQ
jgi:hypothetical protein